MIKRKVLIKDKKRGDVTHQSFALLGIRANEQNITAEQNRWDDLRQYTFYVSRECLGRMGKRPKYAWVIHAGCRVFKSRREAYAHYGRKWFDQKMKVIGTPLARREEKVKMLQKDCRRILRDIFRVLDKQGIKLAKDAQPNAAQAGDLNGTRWTDNL